MVAVKAILLDAVGDLDHTTLSSDLVKAVVHVVLILAHAQPGSKFVIALLG